MKGSRTQSSASHLNNHGRSTPAPQTEKARMKAVKGVTLHPAELSPTRIRKRHESPIIPPQSEQQVVMEESENDENSVVSVRSSNGIKVPSERPAAAPAMLNTRGELMEVHLDSTLKQLDTVRHERNQALELNVELEYKVRTLTDRMETALALAEAAKSEASTTKHKRTFFEKRISELESAHKATLDSNVQHQEEVVKRKLTITKLMADLTRVNNDKKELEGRVEKLMKEHTRHEHKHAEVQAMKEKLEGLKSAFDAREEEEEKEAVLLQQFVEKEKLARIAEEKKNEQLRAELVVVKSDLENRERQLEDSLSQTLSLHEQLKELKKELTDKATEIQSLVHIQSERDMAHDAERKGAEEKEDAQARTILELKKELEAHHNKLSDFMKSEQDTQAGLFTQLTESKKEAQEHMIAFHEAEKTIRQWKKQYEEATGGHIREKELLQEKLELQSEMYEASSLKSKELHSRVDELEQAVEEARTALQGHEENHSTAMKSHENYQTEAASRELALRKEAISLREELNKREGLLNELREQIKDKEQEHAQEVGEMMKVYEVNLNNKLMSHKEEHNAVVTRVKEEAAAAMQTHKKESEQDSDNLVKKHIRIVEQLADMHRAELESLEEQAAHEERVTAASLQRVTTAFEQKVGVLEQELENMKGLLEKERESKHAVQSQLPLVESEWAEKVATLQAEVARLHMEREERDQAHAVKVKEAVHDLNQLVEEHAIRLRHGDDEIDQLSRKLTMAREEAIATEKKLELDLQKAKDELQGTFPPLFLPHLYSLFCPYSVD